MPSRLAKTRPLSAASLGPTSEAAPEVSRREPAACAYCFETGMEVVAGRGAGRCRCRVQERRQRLRVAARIPRRYAQCTRANYCLDPGQGTQLRAFNYAFKLVDELTCGSGRLQLSPEERPGLGRFQPAPRVKPNQSPLAEF